MLSQRLFVVYDLRSYSNCHLSFCSSVFCIIVFDLYPKKRNGLIKLTIVLSWDALICFGLLNKRHEIGRETFAYTELGGQSSLEKFEHYWKFYSIIPLRILNYQISWDRILDFHNFLNRKFFRIQTITWYFFNIAVTVIPWHKKFMCFEDIWYFCKNEYYNEEIRNNYFLLVL